MDETIYSDSILDSERTTHLTLLMNNTRTLKNFSLYTSTQQALQTSPELHLNNGDKNYNWTQRVGNFLLSASHTDELAWLIPAAIVGIFIFIAIAFVCFYGLRALELRIMSCCYGTCGCCCPDARQGFREETVALTSSDSHSLIEMRGYQTTASTSRDSDYF